MGRPSSIRSALTLLELLCAATLVTMLMVALLGVVGGLARAEAALERRAPPPEWRRRVTRALRDDLRAADAIEATANGIRLNGPLARDSASGVAEWTEATIEYRVEASPLGPVWLRVETPSAIGTRRRSEPLVMGAVTLVVSEPTAAVTDGATSLVPTAPESVEPRFVNGLLRGEGPPTVLRVTLYDQIGATLYDEVIDPR